MILLHPIWLFLAIPLAVSVWIWWPPSRAMLVLRILSLVLVLMALCGVSLSLPSHAGTVVVVVDHSLSMPADSESVQKEAIDMIQASMSSDDRLGVVTFGDGAVVERVPQTGKFAGFLTQVNRDASDLAGALERALALIPRDNPGHVLILSDGRWTGRDPSAIAALAAVREVALDYRPMQRPLANDLAIARVEAPATVNPGEAFLLTAWVQAPTSQMVSYELRRGTRRLASGQRQMTAGLNRLTFRDRAVESGNQPYTLTVTGTSEDPWPENNTAHILVGVQGPRPLLCITSSPRSGLPRLLQAGGLQVKSAAPDACTWSLEELARYSAVLLENVPAEKIGMTGMETLATWVRETGSGLMVTGGKASYGTGGYYRSPLEPILPVTMELRNEHRKLSLAIVVALDRSGSMAMPVGGGRVKMDLANLGTVAVLDLLGPRDEFGVIAVDTDAHIIANLHELKDKEAVRNDVLGIRSMGGGIYIDVALEASLRMIQSARAGTKHIVLFADANDAEQSPDYKAIVDRCLAVGITVSVIGLGTERDHDAQLLKDIAARGKGRVFFSDRPEELPRLFAQDTFVVARSTFLDEPTKVEATPALTTLTDRSFTLAQPVGGYNLCYIRPDATLAALTLDEYQAPLVASWHAGAGRVLCYTGEADGRYTGAMAKWKDVGEFYTSLARWTVGRSATLRDNMMVTQKVQNGVNQVRLHLDPDRQADTFSALPQATILRTGTEGGAPKTEKSSLNWIDADTLALDVPLQGQGTALTVVDIPGQEPVALAPVCLPYSPEFKPIESDTGLAALEHLARATGGKERLDLASIWREIPRHQRVQPITIWLLGLAALLLLLEVLERRSGLFLRQLDATRALSARLLPHMRRTIVERSKPSTTPAIPQPTIAVSTPERPVAEPPPSIETKPTLEETGGMLDALRQARERGRHRTDR